MCIHRFISNANHVLTKCALYEALSVDRFKISINTTQKYSIILLYYMI